MHCGCPINIALDSNQNMHENKSDYPRLKELDNASLFYCPKCGKIMYVEENEVKTVKCLACGNNNIIDTNFLLVDFLLLSEEEKRKWENNLLNNCIIKNKEFNMRQYNLFCNPNTTDSLYNCYDEKYRDIENEIKEKEYLSVKKPVKNVGVVLCPICGSTQIQMVQRKWRLLTGF